MTLNEIYSTPDVEQRRALMSVLAQRAKLHAEKTGVSFESALMALTERDKPSTQTGDQAHVYQASDLIRRARAHADARGCDFLEGIRAVMARDDIDAIARKGA